ncbi:MAG: acetyl-CoA C-acyltransferase [Bacteroidetes bacterium]|nr:acetyl-CoA C-acyltransferase [Bacteroidota bacterium]
MTKEVYIVAAVRTAMGSFMGTLAGVPATKLGAAAIKGALEKINLNPNEVQEVYFGSVLQAGLGQAPARQAAKYAGLPNTFQCTTINKVCASGMKAISLGAQQILTGVADVVVAGGMENMSAVPHYLMGSRSGFKYGNIPMLDGLSNDGLLDAYNNQMMGWCADLCATEYKFTREQQDEFAINSYKKAAQAWADGKFNDEIVPVEITDKKGNISVFNHDEEYKAVNFDKIPGLRAVFSKEGTVTAANASTMNDGAAAVILMSKEKAEALGIKPIAKITGFADAEHEPEWFTTAPSKAMPKAAAMAGKQISEIDYFEFNEAFSVVGLVNNQLLNIDSQKVNVNGGAVALGHPLGASGARIIVTLLNVLKQNGGKVGGAAICNGGGGASAMVVELV